tara:strand:+ start:1802 stop:2341 length:540 start_codon:yes stop_codon:yes gene_type:complete
MLISVNSKNKDIKEFKINNSPKLTVLALSVLSLASLIIAMKVNVSFDAPTYFLLTVMLFPMSHLFNSYNAILQVRAIEGLKPSEIKRLNHTIQVRSNSIVKIMMIYISVISMVVTLGVTGFLSSTQSLFLSLSIIISSLFDTKFAWDTLAEIRDFEQKLLLRLKRKSAHEDIMKEANGK